MIVYEAVVERVERGFIVGVPSLNWGFFHGDLADGGRATLEAHTRKVLFELEGVSDFGVAYDWKVK